MRRAPVFRRRERLGISVVVLLTYVLTSYVSYAIVSVLLDGRGLLQALVVGLNPGWALLPLGFFAALLGAALFGVLGRARRFNRRAALAVIAVLSTVGGLRLIAFAGEAALVTGGTVQNVTPAATSCTSSPRCWSVCSSSQQPRWQLSWQRGISSQMTDPAVPVRRSFDATVATSILEVGRSCPVAGVIARPG